LQDQAAPAPWPQVEQVLRADLDGQVEEVFAWFDREPLAAASVAQVHGRLSVHVRLFADERDRHHLTGRLHQVLLTILAATAGIMAVLLLGTGGGPRVTATVSLYQLLGYNLLVVCAILALRVLVLIFRPDR
jgi:hypothetical protein